MPKGVLQSPIVGVFFEVLLNIIRMKKLHFYFKPVLLFLLSGLFFISCDKGDDPEPEESSSTFTSLSSPYLICANRNPGGVGFDFEYDGKTGGANNMDSLTVDDFEADVVIKTIKADSDGSATSANMITLNNGAQAVNYSSSDASCKGYTAFQNLTYSTASAKGLTFSSDGSGYTLTGLTNGTSGFPLLTEVNTQIAKLVIGDKWKAPAKNSVADDEPIFIIKTQEGLWVKLIVTEFPATTNAPTATGYVAIEWALMN